MKITAERGKIAHMIGDGNCLLRTFSAILFEVQRTIKS